MENKYFMGIAIYLASKSYDPNRKIGACIVRDNKLLGTGDNFDLRRILLMDIKISVRVKVPSTLTIIIILYCSMFSLFHSIITKV